MKKLLLFNLIIFAFTFAVNAQNGQTYTQYFTDSQLDTTSKNNVFTHNEVGFSLGVHPIGVNCGQPGTFWGPDYASFDFFEYAVCSTDSWLEYYSYQVGALNLYYFYNFSSQHRFYHSVGFSLSTTLTKSDVKLNDIAFSGISTHITFNTNYRFTFLSFSNCSLYFGAGLGFLLGIESKELNQHRNCWGCFISPTQNANRSQTWARFNCQLTCFGLRIGKTNAANIELGIGTEGFFKVGYSGRF